MKSMVTSVPRTMRVREDNFAAEAAHLPNIAYDLGAGKEWDTLSCEQAQCWLAMLPLLVQIAPGAAYKPTPSLHHGIHVSKS